MSQPALHPQVLWELLLIYAFSVKCVYTVVRFDTLPNFKLENQQDLSRQLHRIIAAREHLIDKTESLTQWEQVVILAVKDSEQTHFNALVNIFQKKMPERQAAFRQFYSDNRIESKLTEFKEFLKRISITLEVRFNS